MVWPDEDPRYKYSDARRDNPEIKAKVAKVITARQAALKEADALLKKAANILYAQSVFIDDPIYNRQVANVRSASESLDHDTLWEVGESHTANPTENDIYLCNLAAGPLGEQIESMGDEFPL